MNLNTFINELIMFRNQNREHNGDMEVEILLTGELFSIESLVVDKGLDKLLIEVEPEE